MSLPSGLRSLAAAVGSGLSLCSTAPGAPEANPTWLSPCALVAAPDGATLFVACATGRRVLVLDLSSRRVVKSVPVPKQPSGLAVSADGEILYVACAGPASQVCFVDIAKARVTGAVPVGHTACAPVVSPDGKTLFVCNRFNDDVSVIDLIAKREIRRIPVRREPVAAAISPDGRRVLVANHLHAGRADAGHVAAVVSVIETALGKVVEELWLPEGSGSLNDLRISPDGKYAVVTHVLGRFHLPTTQLERGWMNTNAKTIIALDPPRVLNTVLLDTVDRGAANPWGAAWSADGKSLVVALAGAHEVSVTDFPALLEKLGRIEPNPRPQPAAPRH